MLSLFAMSLAACGSAARIEEGQQAVLGEPRWDSSCLAPAQNHLRVGVAYGRIAVNSAAFAECVATAMVQNTNAGRNDITIGPYNRCESDPVPTDASTVLAYSKKPNDLLFSCDYSKIGTSEAARSGYVDSAGNERFTFGGVLGKMQTEKPNCNFNPDGLTDCVDDDTYIMVGDSTVHEVLHDYGYNHVEGDRLCGIPASQNPTYANSVNYIVSECIRSVLTQSKDLCPMHDDCGAGLKLVDSVFTGPASCHCVADPKVGSPAPLPPKLPIGCIVTTHCDGSASLACNPRGNAFVLQSRRTDVPGAGWVDGAQTTGPVEYRACETSIYGRACTGPIQAGSDCGGGFGGGGTGPTACNILCPKCVEAGGYCRRALKGCLCE
jgi:hypothetical protein